MSDWSAVGTTIEPRRKATSGQASAAPMGRSALEFLPAALEVLETPPRPMARTIALVFTMTFLVAIAWALIGQIDTVAVATGQIVPTERVKLIQPLENGIVRAILVRDGQRVKAGDVLVELDPTDAQSNTEAIRYDLLKSQLDAAAAAALLLPDPERGFEPPAGASGVVLEAARLQMLGELDKHKASLAGIEADIIEQKATLVASENQLTKAKTVLPLVEERLAALEALNAKDLIRKPELLAVKEKRVEVVAEMATAKSGIEQARARIESRSSRRAELTGSFRADALQRRSEALRKAASLEQQLRKEVQRHADRQLRAPVDGVIYGLSVHTVGGVVATKDVLLRILPEGSELEAEITILNKDIGFVEKGQPVEIKIEAFPFTRFGLIEGEVKLVWQDAVPDDKQGLVYKAIVRLKDSRILVGSKWVPLGPGMAVQAEIRTGERRIMEIFLSPFIRYRDEALRER